MSKGKISVIISLMVISLIGLLGFQYYWINQVIEEKESLVDNSIKKALAGLEDSVEDKEAFLFVKGNVPTLESDSFIFKDRNAFNFITDVTIDSTTDNVLKKIETRYEFSSNSEESSEMLVLGDGEQEISVIHLGDSSQSKIKMIQRFNEKKGELTEAIERIAFEFAFLEVPFKDRIDIESFDSLLTNRLDKEGLAGLNYHYSLTDLESDSLLLNDLEEGELEGTDIIYEQKLLEDEGSKGGLLTFLPIDRSFYLLREIWQLLIVTLLLSLFLLFTFGYTINSILKQKRLSKMKSDFINNMTHEFKTPIATISLAVDSIHHPEVLKNEEQIKKYGEIIRKENDRMHNQVERILQAAQFEQASIKFNSKRISLHKIIEEVVGSFHSNTEHNRKYKVDLLAGDDFVKADPMHLYNVIRNLLDNAVKYSSEESLIEVFTHNPNSSQIELRIKDQGIGMSKETQKHIFDRFYRHTEGDLHQTKGFGLGLAYVSDVIDQMDGSITADSKIGAGSTFRVILNTCKDG